jgi:hypothetical protein
MVPYYFGVLNISFESTVSKSSTSSPDVHISVFDLPLIFKDLLEKPFGFEKI